MDMRRGSSWLLKVKKIFFMSLSMAKKVNICENNPHVHLLQNITGKERKASGQLKEIPVPVISVLGAGENCGKFSFRFSIITSWKKEDIRF